MFNYRNVILFHIKTFDDQKYDMKQLSDGDAYSILDLDENNRLIIDGIDEL